jgi:hypothetical protein
MKGMVNAGKSSKGITDIVFSRTLKASDYPTVLSTARARVTLKLRSQHVYKKTGTIGVEYDIVKIKS